MKKNLPNLLALAVVYAAVLLGWQWVWGVLFIMWTIPAFYSGEVFLVSPISKKTSPFLFWVVVVTWIGLSVYLVVADLIPFIQSL